MDRAGNGGTRGWYQPQHTALVVADSQPVDVDSSATLRG